MHELTTKLLMLFYVCLITNLDVIDTIGVGNGVFVVTKNAHAGVVYFSLGLFST